MLISLQTCLYYLVKAFFTLDEFARSCCNVGIMQCLEVEFWKVSNLPESSLHTYFSLWNVIEMFCRKIRALFPVY